MPDIKVPTMDINKAAAEFNKALKDGAYVAVGLGVLGFQKAQVQRVEFAKQIDAQLAQLSRLPEAREQLSGLAKAIEDALAPVRDQLAKTDLSEPLSAASELIETQVQTFRAQINDLAKMIDERFGPTRQQLDDRIDRIEERLPEGARNVVHTVRSAASTQEHALRSAVGLA